MKLMTIEMKQIKDENKELKKICSELLDENKNARGKMPATNAQTPSYANTAKNALIVKTADSGNITEKRAKIAKALSDVQLRAYDSSPPLPQTWWCFIWQHW